MVWKYIETVDVNNPSPTQPTKKKIVFFFRKTLFYDVYCSSTQFFVGWLALGYYDNLRLQNHFYIFSTQQIGKHKHPITTTNFRLAAKHPNQPHQTNGATKQSNSDWKTKTPYHRKSIKRLVAANHLKRNQSVGRQPSQPTPSNQPGNQATKHLTS